MIPKILIIAAGLFWFADAGASHVLAVGDQSSSDQSTREPLPQAQPEITLGFADDITYGEADAPVTIIEYASMTCSHCGTFANDIFPRIYAKYILTGRVRMLFRNYVLNGADMAIALITRCQGEDQARAMIDKFFATQSTWLQSKQPRLAVTSIAAEFGLTEQDVNTCIANQPLQRAIAQKMQEAMTEYDIKATPTIIVDGTKLDSYAWEVIDSAIQAALEKQGVATELSR